MNRNQTRHGVALAVLGMLMALLTCAPASANAVLHKFQLWGTMKPVEKLIFYQGWTNGFLAARGPRGAELATCLEGLSGEQALAMIDKQYNDHPERWSHAIGEGMLQALTAEGGPCEGKNPLDAK